MRVWTLLLFEKFGAGIRQLACGTRKLGRCPPRWAPRKLPRPLTNVPPRPRELLCVCAAPGGFALICSVSFMDVGRFSSILFHLFRTCSYRMGCSSWTARAAFSLITLLKSLSTTSALRLCKRKTIELNNWFLVFPCVVIWVPARHYWIYILVS